MIPVNQVKTGIVIRFENRLFTVLGFTHTKPGKGGAYLRMKLKDIITGQLIERTVSTDDKVEDVFIEERKLTYLYKDKGIFHFLDEATFEEIEIPESELENIKYYLKENAKVSANFHEGKVVSITPSTFVELKVIDTEPGFKGDTVKSQTKSARLETGLVVDVPLFINVGDILKIDIRTGEYVERV